MGEVQELTGYVLDERRRIGLTGRCAVYRYSRCERYTLDHGEIDLLRPVILKVARDPDKNAVAGLRDEYRVLGEVRDGLKARNLAAAMGSIPEPIEFGRIGGCDALVMGFIAGRSLEDLVTCRRERPVPEWLVALTLARLMQTLEVVHDLLGRSVPDLKRNSIRVGRASVGIIDWNVLGPLTPETRARDRRELARYASELHTGRFTERDREIEALWTGWDGGETARDPDVAKLRRLLVEAGRGVGRVSSVARDALDLAKALRGDLSPVEPPTQTWPERVLELADQAGWLGARSPDAQHRDEL